MIPETLPTPLLIKMKFYEIRPVEGNAFQRHCSHLTERLQVIVYRFCRRITSILYLLCQHCKRHSAEI